MHVAPELADRLVIIDGVCKACAMTGWRIGFCAAPLVDAMQTLQGQVTRRATAVAQHAALARPCRPGRGAQSPAPGALRGPGEIGVSAASRSMT